MPLDFETMFDDKCNQEIVRRKAGKVFYGPPKIFALAVCEKDGVNFLGNKLSRSTAALIIVCTDIAISVIFTLALFRLRWYEQLVEKDRQLLQPVVDDFSVYMPTIPISPKDYDKNPELLTAMISTHLESVLTLKFMQDDKLNEDEAKDLSQVSSIHYGLREHHPISYLVKISECVK